MGVIEEIEWNARARQITASSISRSRRKKRSFFSGWRLMAPVLASVFVLGFMLGYLLFHSQGAPVEFPLEPETADLSFNRIESTLARKEVLHFLKQSQLLLTELMVRCDKDGLVFLDSKIKKDQINALLKKSRYLDHHLNDPQLMSSKNLLAEIELLLYEISALEKNISCRSIQNLQQSIHQQRLFFKIRLIEKELSLYEV
jgi:hypothetical protein